MGNAADLDFLRHYPLKIEEFKGALSDWQKSENSEEGICIIELKKMAEMEYHLPETFLKIVREDPEYRIYLLEGEKLIFFPA
jgi:hypothetical protein